MSSGHHSSLFVPGSTVVHRLEPEVKIVAVFAFVIAVAVTPRRSIGSFAVDFALVVIAFAFARLRPRIVLTRLAVVLPFIGFAVLIPFIAGGPETTVLGVSVSTEGLWGAWNIGTKAVLGASASILLTSTTPVAEILQGLSRLKAPAIVVAIMTFMFRYLDLIVDEMRRMRTAMVARAHDPLWLWQAKPIATGAGALFVRSYERGERVHHAMQSRGFTGTMPRLDSHSASAREWITAALVPTVAVIALVAGVITT